MTTTEKKSAMSRIRNNKGFTLIEMAIVLVIIGIILGAVMKGQDLISNSKSKGVTSAISNWKALIYTYVDRNSRMPGDVTRTGLINKGTTSNEAMFQLYSSMSSAPTNPVVVGGTSYWIYLNNDTKKNIMLVCTNAACSQDFSNDDVEMFKSVDASIDGSAAGNSGNFRSFNAALPSFTEPSKGFHGDAGKLTSGGGEATSSAPVTNSVTLAAGSFLEWASGTGATKAAVYYFDKSY